MRTWPRLSKLGAVVAVAGIASVTAAPAAVAHENEAADQAARRACGGGVFLDGIRALDVLEEGERDEVYIVRENGVTDIKVWPRTSEHVSMAEGQRVEVDKCVPVGAELRLWDADGPLNPDDFMGYVKITTESTHNHFFDNGKSSYRLGVVA